VSTPDIAAAMQAAMDAEDRRRELASATPGLGVLLPLDQPPSGPSVGKYGVGGAIVGEGYDQQAEIAAAIHKSYGADRPQYAHPLVAGLGYPADTHQPALRHVMDLGADGLFIEDRSGAPAGDVVTVASAPSRPGLLSRARAALGRLRRR
jgi:hypothetical protein